MRYTAREVTALLRTPVGRTKVLLGVGRRAWPALSKIARAYRSTVGRRTRVIAVVGSFGKTTTARAVAAALGARSHRHISLNSYTGLAAAILRIRPGDRHAVVEVGIRRPGQMASYARVVRPDITVVTTIGSEHNRSLPTLEVTRAEKAHMVRALRGSGLAVLNGDDPHVRWMAGQTRARLLTFGLQAGNDVRATEVVLDWPNGTTFRLHANGDTRRVRVRLIGRHQVFSILAAVAVAMAEGFHLDDVLPRLEALEPTPGRMKPHLLPNGAFLLRDGFKSPVETIDAALDVLAEIPARRIVVLGDVAEPPGSQGPIYRRLGNRLAEIATRVIVVGGSFRRYRVGATQGGLSSEAILDAGRSVFRATAALAEDLKPGDVVLIKGRNTQKLDRIALILEGRQVRCGISHCAFTWVSCQDCPMLERGWDGLPIVT